MQEAASSRQKRAVLGGQVASQGGIIKVSQCWELCSKRKQKEEKKAKRKKASVTVRPSVVRTAGPTANIAGVPVIVE